MRKVFEFINKYNKANYINIEFGAYTYEYVRDDNDWILEDITTSDEFGYTNMFSKDAPKFELEALMDINAIIKYYDEYSQDGDVFNALCLTAVAE